ncbi:MAG: hypothetical protein II837_02175 [Treponema sp.]|nr:hypothetical protein [Treponema sp.]
MKLENADLENIIKSIEFWLKRNESTLERNPPDDWVAEFRATKKTLDKLKDFMETCGTTCPTAILSCPFALGSRTSDKKATASRENGKKGGRPRKISQNVK